MEVNPFTGPHYSTDLNACREAELQFEKGNPDPSGGRILRMVEELLELLDVDGFVPDCEEFWKILTADAATRCRAMLLALEAK